MLRPRLFRAKPANWVSFCIFFSNMWPIAQTDVEYLALEHTALVNMIFGHMTHFPLWKLWASFGDLFALLLPTILQWPEIHTKEMYWLFMNTVIYWWSDILYFSRNVGWLMYVFYIRMCTEWAVKNSLRLFFIEFATKLTVL